LSAVTFCGVDQTPTRTPALVRSAWDCQIASVPLGTPADQLIGSFPVGVAGCAMDRLKRVAVL
jgi:hypothetical protein